MNKAVRVAAMTATIGMATVSPTATAHAGDAVGAGLIGFGVGAILGSLFTPWEVYVGPPPYYYEPVVNASTCALSPSLVLSSIEPFNHQTKTATTAAIARTDSGAPSKSVGAGGILGGRHWAE